MFASPPVTSRSVPHALPLLCAPFLGSAAAALCAPPKRCMCSQRAAGPWRTSSCGSLPNPLCYKRTVSTTLGTSQPWASRCLWNAARRLAQLTSLAAVTKSVLLPFSAAQGASIKFYSIVDYFLYMIRNPLFSPLLLRCNRLAMHCSKGKKAFHHWHLSTSDGVT